MDVPAGLKIPTATPGGSPHPFEYCRVPVDASSRLFSRFITLLLSLFQVQPSKTFFFERLYVIGSHESGTDGTYPQRRSEEHTSELQSRGHLVCRLLLEKKNERTGCLTSTR